MSRTKTTSEPKRRVYQACLPFDDKDAADAVSAKPGAAQDVGPAAVQAVVPCLGPNDPNAYLDAMSYEQLRRHIDELEASPDRRPARIEKLFKAIGVLKRREGLSRPRRVRSDPASVTPPAARPQDVAGPRRLRFGTVLGRVDKTAGAKQVEDLAQRLAEDLSDARSTSMFRRIAGWVRSGEVKSKVVSRAYAPAKRPGVNRPAAVFTWYVFDRSPRVVFETRLRDGERGSASSSSSWSPSPATARGNDHHGGYVHETIASRLPQVSTGSTGRAPSTGHLGYGGGVSRRDAGWLGRRAVPAPSVDRAAVPNARRFVGRRRARAGRRRSWAPTSERRCPPMRRGCRRRPHPARSREQASWERMPRLRCGCAAGPAGPSGSGRQDRSEAARWSRPGTAAAAQASAVVIASM